jgi:hypothetical protein
MFLQLLNSSKFQFGSRYIASERSPQKTPPPTALLFLRAYLLLRSRHGYRPLRNNECTLNSAIECLLCRKVAMDVSSRSRILALSPHVPISKSVRFSVLSHARCIHLTAFPWTFKLYFATSTNYEASRYVNFSTLPLLHPPWAQIFSSAPCSTVVSSADKSHA